MKPTLNTTGRAIGIAILAVLALISALVWASTQPRLVTPVVQKAVALGSGHPASLSAAWISYGPMPVIHLRDLEIESRAGIETLDITPNLLGLLPFVPLAEHVNAENGSLTIDRAAGNSASTEYDRFVDTVYLREIAVEIRRETAVSGFNIKEAQGSLHGGSLWIYAVAGDGTVEFDGKGRLTSLSTIEGEVRVSGPNLATVADALGIAAPDVPPFVLTGDLAVQPDAWVLTGIGGEIGESDIGGNLTIDFAGDRPGINGNLVSEELDFDDLGVILGLPSRNEGGDALNPAQERANQDYATSGRLIPNASIDLERLSDVNADVTYEAASVVGAPFSISSIALDIELVDSVLTISRFDAATAGGTLAMTGTLNASAQPAETELRAQFNGMQMEQIVPDDYALGGIQGGFTLALTGSNFRDAFANANGTALLWAEDSQVAALPIEAADLDIGEALTVLAGNDDGSPVYVAAPCLVLRLDIEDGIGRTAPVLVETEDSLVVGEGTVSLRDETFDMIFKADAKDMSWGRLLGDLSLGGQWRDPQIGVAAEGTAVQGLLAGVLGSIAGPLAALPFLETGDGEAAPCQRILAKARGTPEAGEAANTLP